MAIAAEAHSHNSKLDNVNAVGRLLLRERCAYAIRLAEMKIALFLSPLLLRVKSCKQLQLILGEVVNVEVVRKAEI